MGIFDRVKRAYTLAEIIIVLVVIAVVVAVTMRVAKTKLDNITTYTYYSAYGVLNDVTAQMLADFNPNREEYTEISSSVHSNYSNLFLFLPKFVWVGGGELPARAKTCTFTYAASYMPDMTTPNGTSVEDVANQLGVTPNEVMKCFNAGLPTCKNGGTPLYDFTNCKASCVVTYECPDVTRGCTQISEAQQRIDYCRDRKTDYDSTTCKYKSFVSCASGTHWSSTEPCGCVPDTPTPPPTPEPCTQKTAEQQQQDYCDNGYTDYNSETCDYDTKPGTWPDCPAGTHWDPTVPDCKCVPDNATVPRKGANFCNMFVSLANTRTGTMCNGSAVAADTTDFSDITADIVLRNGMKIFNASQDPATIPDLSLTDHTGAKITKADGTEIYTDEFGYVLYIDIDGGRNGGSVLWEDVFPFYVTLSGKVIPAYKTDAIAQFGGGSRYYLQTSLQVDSVDAQGATQFWLDGAKSISFRQAACMSGYVGAATQYCSRTPAVTESATCSEENNSCSIKKVSPIRWF